MGRVYYCVATATVESLDEMLTLINRDQDKIIAVTQSGDIYTIFYERNGNVKDGEGE